MGLSKPVSLIGPDLVEWFNARYTHQMGAVDGQDILFLAAMVEEFRPRKIVEIGCASGLSTSVLAHLVEQVCIADGAEARIDSFDVYDRFYADPSKPMGYLLDEALAHPHVDVTLNTPCTALDVMERTSGDIDLCFIDASHEHPWPTIDTLAVLPAMRPGGIIVHHDLQMYQLDMAGIYGPKIVMDQVDDGLVRRSWSIYLPTEDLGLMSRWAKDNIFALVVPEDRDVLAWQLAQGFHLPWEKNLYKGVPDDFAERFCAVMADLGWGHARHSFERGFETYNPKPSPMDRGRRFALMAALRDLRAALGPRPKRD
ncbi:MAG: class I SAM-dependent methyltransferase [Pseudomonadota bacterium]